MERKPVCIIFGAGEPPTHPPIIASCDLVIAADGGYGHLRSMGVRTDVLIGDFDSIGALPSKKDGPRMRRLPCEKDETDMLAALKYGLGCGFTRFHIYGGTGGRLDHTLANIQCLAFLANQGARGYLYEGDTVVTAFKGEMRLEERHHGVLSVFALGGTAKGVCLRGLKYELEGATISCDFPIGISNVFTGHPVFIKVEHGVLAVVYPVGTLEYN